MTRAKPHPDSAPGASAPGASSVAGETPPPPPPPPSEPSAPSPHSYRPAPPKEPPPPPAPPPAGAGVGAGGGAGRVGDEGAAVTHRAAGRAPSAPYPGDEGRHDAAGGGNLKGGSDAGDAGDGAGDRVGGSGEHP